MVEPNKLLYLETNSWIPFKIVKLLYLLGPRALHDGQMRL